MKLKDLRPPGISQQELACFLGISRQGVSLMELAENPSAGQIARYKAALARAVERRRRIVSQVLRQQNSQESVAV